MSDTPFNPLPMQMEDDLYPPVTIGLLIDALRCAPPERSVIFDFCRLFPYNLDVWAGAPGEAILEPVQQYSLRSGGASKVTVETLLAWLESAIRPDVTHTGYRGDTYVFTRATRLHVDIATSISHTEITWVDVASDPVMLHTAYRPPETL